jgi:hypothetical protein
MRRKLLLMSVLLLGLMPGAFVGLSMAQDEDSEAGASPQALVGTAFTYQGRLTDGGIPANGAYDFGFVLQDAPSYGSQVASTYVQDVEVTEGLFSVELDFGQVFDGTALWMTILVRPGDSTGGYTALDPAQALTAAPYALALPGLWTQPNTSSPNLIGGYSGNEVAAGVAGATISGGGSVSAPNRVTANLATVGGGTANDAGGYGATVGGGQSNEASGDYATVGGGYNNDAPGERATIAGGAANDAGGYGATVGGGSLNDVSGDYATVPGGIYNDASGQYSFAAGYRAKATHDGSFVLADSTDADFASVREDALRVRFNGGATFAVNDDYWVRFWSNAGRLIDTSTGAHLTTGGVWTNDSDREAKENFAPVDGQAVLARLAAVPIQTWNYKAEDPAVRRMGPTAQDFYAAFGLGEGKRHISTIDADGVALAAIQGLYEQVQEQAARIQALEAENARMQQVLEDLSVRLAALEAAQTAGEARP